MKFISDGTAETIMHPVRWQILRTLRQNDGPMFVEQIANVTKIHPRLVSHHLDVLEEQGLISSSYKLVKLEKSKRPVAVRLCTATAKVDQAIKDIREEKF